MAPNADLERLRARFDDAPASRSAPAERIVKARRLRVLKREMTGMLSDVQACRTCAKGSALPAGRWDGGHCCASRTLSVFTLEEVALLKLGGTTPSRLKTPETEQAGCVFRGAQGCSLKAEDRPTICLRYLCAALRDELRRQPSWPHIERARRALLREFPSDGLPIARRSDSDTLPTASPRREGQVRTEGVARSSSPEQA